MFPQIIFRADKILRSINADALEVRFDDFDFHAVFESAQLFKEPFLSDCKKALRPCGILAVQAESCLLAPEVAEAQFRMIQKLFVNAGYCTVPVPSRPGGSAGLCFGCDDHGVETPCRRPIGAFVRRLTMYSMEVHKAAFVLPPFGTKRFEPEED